MDARLTLLLLQHHRNENNLPYPITELPGEREVSAYFEETDTADLAQVQSWPPCASVWAPGCSAFYANWINCVGSGSVLKLKVRANINSEIQGLIKLDDQEPCGLADRIMETAPHNQAGNPARKFRGVGVALVARMALECLLYGQSTFLIQTTPRNVPFYTRLGFVPALRSNRLYLSRQDAEQLLTELFFG